MHPGTGPALVDPAGITGTPAGQSIRGADPATARREPVDGPPGGLRPKSEVTGYAVAAPRQVLIEWTAQI